MIREVLTLPRLWKHLHSTRQQIVAYQNRKLRRLIRHAYDNVPYYRSLFEEAGLRPADIQAASDLAKLPITSKSALHSRPAEDFIARGVDPAKLIVRTSGGSTGEPVRIRRTWFEERLLNAFRFRAAYAAGMRLNDRAAYVVLLAGSQGADRQGLAKLLGLIGWFRAEKLSVMRPADELMRELERIQPDVIIGNAGAMAMVAQRIIDDGRTSIRPRLVVTGADVLTPLMRRQISQAFSAPVCNMYGANEFNLVAWECIKTGQMHTCDDLAIVEIVRGGQPVLPGQRGEVVGTCLHSYAMPIIRFSLKDVATRGPESCPCGAPFSTISGVQGRMIDYFPMPDGRLIHPYEFFDRILHDRADWVRQYQVVQQRLNLVVLRAVTSRIPTTQRLDEIKRDAARLLGPEVEFQIEFHSKLDFEPNGKFRSAQSKVHSVYDAIDWDRADP